MRSVKGLVVALAMVAATGCALVEPPPGDDPDAPSSGPDASGSSTPSPSVGPDVDPRGFPLEFDADTKTIFPEKPVYDGLVVGARAVTMTLDKITARALPGLETSWEISPTGLFVDIEESDEQVYALDIRVVEGAGTSAGRLAMNLTRVAPSSGAVMDDASWELRQDVQASGDPVVQIVGVDGDVVLVQSTNSGEDSRVTLTAVDVAAGERLWTRRPGEFVAWADDTVVMTTGTAGDAGPLVAVDATTGRTRWTAAAEVATASEVGVRGDDLLLVTESGGNRSPRLVSLALSDGSVTASEPTAHAGWACQPALEDQVVCSLPGERALGYDLRTRKVLWQLPTAGRYGIWISSVRGGYVYGFTSGARSVVLAADTGSDVTESAGAAPVSSNGYGGMIFYGGQAIFYPAVPDSVEAPE